MRITAHLHATLLQQAPPGSGGVVALKLPEGADAAGALAALEIALPPDALILVVGHHVVRPVDALHDGEALEIFPAISGG